MRVSIELHLCACVLSVLTSPENLESSIISVCNKRPGIISTPQRVPMFPLP